MEDWKITDQEVLKQYYAYCPKCGEKIHPTVKIYSWFGFEHCYFDFDLADNNVNKSGDLIDSLTEQYRNNPGKQTLMQFLNDRGITEDEYRIHFINSISKTTKGE